MAKAKKRKQHAAGEPKKGAEKRGPFGKDLADRQDHKRGNIGPSGQGTHRGRERRNTQTGVSGRPDVPPVGSRRQMIRR
jgi:hypothetical protein